MTETTDLALLEIKPEQAPTLYVQSGLDPYLDMIREMAKEVPDVTTKKGRDRIGSLAQAISRSKTAIEKPGRAYLKHLKEAVKPAEQELKRFVDECNAIRDSVLKVREEWDAEQQRLAEIEAMNTAHTEALEMNEAFDKAAAEKFESDHEIALLMNDKFDRDRAEAARLAEQQRIEHEQRIAREAEERVKREVEEKAQREREQVEREKLELHAMIELAKKNAKEAAERVEQGRIEAQQLAERQAREALEKAERDKQEAIEAERRKAAQAEQERLAEEKRIKDEADRRAANEKHRKRIGSEVVTALINVAGLTREEAISAFSAIKDGKVPHTKVNY